MHVRNWVIFTAIEITTYEAGRKRGTDVPLNTATLYKGIRVTIEDHCITLTHEATSDSELRL